MQEYGICTEMCSTCGGAELVKEALCLNRSKQAENATWVAAGLKQLVLLGFQYKLGVLYRNSGLYVRGFEAHCQEEAQAISEEARLCLRRPIYCDNVIILGINLVRLQELECTEALWTSSLSYAATFVHVLEKLANLTLLWTSGLEAFFLWL